MLKKNTKNHYWGMLCAIFITIILMLFIGENISAQEYPSGMVSYWKFDEGSGIVAHDTFGDNDGIIYGATWTTDRVGGELSFDGVDDYVSVPDSDSLDLTDDLTLGFWLKRVGGYGQPAYLINKMFLTAQKGNFNLYIGIGTQDIIGFDIPYGNADQIVKSTTLFNTPVWHHVVLTKSGPEYCLYVDGVLEDSNTNSTAMATTNTPLIIGYFPINESAYFNGLIDDVRIYNRALSDQEIVDLFNAGGEGDDCADELAVLQATLDQANADIEALETENDQLLLDNGQLQIVIDSLVAALLKKSNADANAADEVRNLAQDAIDQAKVEGGKAKKIEKAEKEMAKAQKDYDNGKYYKAINHYKKAWRHAQKAMK